MPASCINQFFVFVGDEARVGRLEANMSWPVFIHPREVVYEDSFIWHRIWLHLLMSCALAA